MSDVNYTKLISAISRYISDAADNPSFQYQHLSGAGSIHLLEKKLKHFYCKKFAICFSSATTALQAVCIAMEIKNDDIITSPINWGGSVSPFLLLGNKLRFTSINPDSFNISPGDIKSAITDKTKAVLSVDYNGTPADSSLISKICKNHRLKYISDGSQSLGAFRDNKPAGFFADVIVLSFSSGKSIFAGEGGAIVTDDESLYEKIIWFSQHPLKQKPVFGLDNYNEYAPLNGRIHPISAIILNESFEKAISILNMKQKKLFQLLYNLKRANLIENSKEFVTHRSSTFFNFLVKLKPSTPIQKLNDFLWRQSPSFVAVKSPVKLIPSDHSFRSQFKGRFSCTARLLKQIQSLPFEKTYLITSKT